MRFRSAAAAVVRNALRVVPRQRCQRRGPFCSVSAGLKPANLTTGNAVVISDGAIFITLSEGVAGRMPAMRENLPEARERWDVVNYVRSLQK